MTSAPVFDRTDSDALTPLADQFARFVDNPTAMNLDMLAASRSASRRDRFMTLLGIYRLHTAPVADLAQSARLLGEPVVAAVKQDCENAWLAELANVEVPDGIDDRDPVASMRTLAARDRLPDVYRWLAREASWNDIVTFLAVEGGPDAGFDDLVAAAQIGLTGRAKLELATNYWDEMGNGELTAVHTTLHQQLAEAVDLPQLPLSGQPVAALERAALGGLLTTNRWLQPEALGALGLIELQAGPRCRLVLQGLKRCGAPAAAYPFYEVHAEVDPRHGQDWLDNAIAPTVELYPQWSERIVRGAVWRSAINAAFLAEVNQMLRTDLVASSAA